MKFKNLLVIFLSIFLILSIPISMGLYEPRLFHIYLATDTLLRPMSKVVYGKGYYFAFYQTNESSYPYDYIILYRSTTDGVEWSDGNYVTKAEMEWFRICSNGTHVAYLKLNPYNFGFSNQTAFYRMGVINLDGTISWLSDEIVIFENETHYANTGDIIFDRDNKVWVALTILNNQESQLAETLLYMNSRVDGNWEIAQGFPVEIVQGNAFNTYVRMFSTGGTGIHRIYILYLVSDYFDLNTTLYFRTFNNTFLSEPKMLYTGEYWGDFFGIQKSIHLTGFGAKAYIVYGKPNNYGQTVDIYFREYNLWTDEISSARNIATEVENFFTVNQNGTHVVIPYGYINSTGYRIIHSVAALSNTSEWTEVKVIDSSFTKSIGPYFLEEISPCLNSATGDMVFTFSIDPLFQEFSYHYVYLYGIGEKEIVQTTTTTSSPSIGGGGSGYSTTTVTLIKSEGERPGFLTWLFSPFTFQTLWDWIRFGLILLIIILSLAIIYRYINQ